MRLIYLAFAYFFLALGIIGIFVPGLPTVPFLLLTAWCASRRSKRLHRWLQHVVSSNIPTFS
ncbi:MAG: YbaN family protein [Burkholderiales bacterium]|nr:YbaN family protein [Burkholderiales bacterium]